MCRRSASSGGGTNGVHFLGSHFRPKKAIVSGGVRRGDARVQVLATADVEAARSAGKTYRKSLSDSVPSIRHCAKRDVSERRRATRGARDARRRARGRCQHSARQRALFRWRRCLARRSPWRPASPAERRLDRHLASEVSRRSDGPRRRRPGVPGASTAWLARRRPPRTRRARSTTSPTPTPSRCARFLLARARPPVGTRTRTRAREETS